MPEILGSDKPILGMPRKVAIPVLGVALVAVVYVVIRSRSQGGAIPRAQPEQGGNTGAIGGSGGGGSVGGVYDAAPVNPIQQRLDQLYLERENFAYNVQQRQEDERQANYEIQHQEQQSTLDAFLSVLPNQIETQKQKEAANQAGYQADVARSGEEAAYANRATAVQNVVLNAINAGKIKPECGKNESSYLDPNTGEWRCKPSGKSGAKSAIDAVGNAALDAIRNVGPSLIAGALKPKSKSSSGSSGGSNASTENSNEHFNIPSYF